LKRFSEDQRFVAYPHGLTPRVARKPIFKIPDCIPAFFELQENQMERRHFVRGAGLAGVLAAGSAPAIVHAQTTIRWRIASSFPKALDTLFGVCDVFAKSMSEMSGGKFTITTHAAGELMPAFGVLDGVSNGTVEMANTAPYYFFGKDPTYALDCAIPFGLNQRQMNAWMIGVRPGSYRRAAH
jgi:TRAP-type mannitol/chloroaromatic compound transport system substrate-binding protein